MTGRATFGCSTQPRGEWDGDGGDRRGLEDGRNCQVRKGKGYEPFWTKGRLNLDRTRRTVAIKVAIVR